MEFIHKKSVSILKLYRIAKEKFINDVSGEGARLYGGRWNKTGDAMLYCSEHLSLCVLEVLVHMDYQYFTDEYYFIEAEISEKDIFFLKEIKKINANWRNNPPVSQTQDYGSQWLEKSEKLALAVPSAVLPFEYNILVNPRHSRFTKIKFSKEKLLNLDARMKV